MNERPPQRRGVESLPITLQSVRPSHLLRPTGYDEQLDDERLYTTRPPSSARRYQTTDPRQQHVVAPRGEQQLRRPNQYDDVRVFVRRRSRQTAQPPPHSIQPPTEPEEEESETAPEPHRRTRPHSRSHWAVSLGIGMMVVVLVWILIAMVLSWWRGYQDNLHYGYPRTFQADVQVGHNDAVTPSHFIALNLHGHIEVIEFPGGDATHAHVYLGPTLSGEGSDLDIVTVSFKDVNGDGKPDMLLVVNGITSVYLNDNGAFRPLKPGEHVNV